MDVHTQRMNALAKGTKTREDKAQLKRAMKAGDASLAQALHAACCQSAKIEALLLCVPGLGPSKVRKLLQAIHISPYRAVRTLTDQERQRLLSSPHHSQRVR